MQEAVAAQAAMPVVVLGYVLFASAVTYAAFRRDGRMAQEGGPRVPEATLLWLTALGGSLGAKAAEWRLDDLGRPVPFRAFVNLIVAAQLVAAAALLQSG